MQTLLYGYRQLHCSYKKDNIYKDIAEDFETRFDTSNLEIDRTLPIGKNSKVVGLIKDKLDGQIMKIFVRLRAKTYSYLRDNNDEDKKSVTQKTQKVCQKKRKLKFQYYKNRLEAAQIESKKTIKEKQKLTKAVLRKIKKNL